MPKKSSYLISSLEKIVSVEYESDKRGRQKGIQRKRSGGGPGREKKIKIQTQRKRRMSVRLLQLLASMPEYGQQPRRVARPGHTWNTYLHGVRRTELHLSKVPRRIPWTGSFPDLLIKTSCIPSIEGEDIVIPLLELVIKRQAAGHGGRGHGGDELGHLLEVLDVNRVHIHVMS